MISNSPVRAEAQVERLHPPMTHITANIKWHLNSAGSEARGRDLRKGTHRRTFVDVFYFYFYFFYIFAVLHCLLFTLHHYEDSFKRKRKKTRWQKGGGRGHECYWTSRLRCSHQQRLVSTSRNYSMKVIRLLITEYALLK